MSTSPVDLTSCDREPIHIPGSIQPHGVLLVLDDDLRIQNVSTNISNWFPVTAEKLVGQSLDSLISGETLETVRQGFDSPSLVDNPLLVATLPGFQAIAHRRSGRLILELEATVSKGKGAFGQWYALVREFLSNLGQNRSIQELAHLAAAEVRRITGYDRLLVYRFDSDWNGEVIAEENNGHLPSYLNLRFPASDIPAQARELYRVNRLRMIVDANYTPVPLVPAIDERSNEPIDLSFAVLRSVSPVHLEYMHNMGTLASMSISIVRDGELWGLISCHNQKPLAIPYEVRTACDLLGQFLSVQISASGHREEAQHRERLRAAHPPLLVSMAANKDKIQGLTSEPERLLACVDADGAAVVAGDECSLIGSTPPRDQVTSIVDWISKQGEQDWLATDCLSASLPEAQTYADQASGMLAISVSKLHRSYVLWFRQEMIRSITWAGDPAKAADNSEEGRIRPRKSFESWKQLVRLHSTPWRQPEIDSAIELRHAIVGVVLRTAEELAQISGELKRSNQELEAFSYSVSHDLRAPFRHVAGYAELLREELGTAASPKVLRYVDTILESTRFAGTLVDNLLTFSQIGRSTISRGRVDMTILVSEVRRDVTMDEAAGRNIDWRIHSLPAVSADLILMRQVWRNLISNAVKYSAVRNPAVIEVRSHVTEGEIVFSVGDNGVGFEMAYADKLFGVFQRLHRIEDFEGTGIGLAIVRRIISRHGGRTWAEGKPGAGATFYFSLPAASIR